MPPSSTEQLKARIAQANNANAISDLNLIFMILFDLSAVSDFNIIRLIIQYNFIMPFFHKIFFHFPVIYCY